MGDVDEVDRPVWSRRSTGADRVLTGRDRIQYKDVAQIRRMRRAGLVVADALEAVRAALGPA